jgi:hypothetical protein
VRTSSDTFSYLIIVAAVNDCLCINLNAIHLGRRGRTIAGLFTSYVDEMLNSLP